MTDLAASAHAELENRVARYPGLVRDRRIVAAEANMDTAVWQAIADWLDGKASLARMFYCPVSNIELDVGSPQIRAALDRAMTSRKTACEKQPDNAARAARLRQVEAIAKVAIRALDFIDGINADLRARLPERRAA